MPTSLRAAFEADKAHALGKRRLSTERLAELMAVTPAVLYKWLENDSMPVNRIPLWEHITGSDYVVRYLTANAHRVVIEIPTGRNINAEDVHVLQATLNGSVGALLDFMKGDMERDTCVAKVSTGLESLAWHRENVRKNDQPELDLD
ncbi:hypothetical protein CJ010_00695 [Azoarcus sp. DD4]|nr:hypothetical protein CJ010_00695 [Azoarcus sp. DD4]